MEFNRLKIMRVARNLRQVDLARVTGLSQARISRIESGRFKPSEEEIALIKWRLGFQHVEI